MRNIVAIDYIDTSLNGITNADSDINELIFMIRPLPNMKSNLKLDGINVAGNNMIVPVDLENGIVTYKLLNNSHFNGSGVMKIRLTSDEGSTPYVTFDCISFNDINEIICCKRKKDNNFYMVKFSETHKIKVIDNLTSSSQIDALSANMGRTLESVKIGFRRNLSSGEDLNNIKEEGYYAQALSANAANGKNYPVGTAGLLTVVNRGSMVYQTYQCFNNEGFYHRAYYTYENRWYEWKRNDVPDSGWVNCTYSSYYKKYSTTSEAQAQVRKIGKTVYLRGSSAPTQTILTTGNTSHLTFTIPAGYRPSTNLYFVFQGSGSNKYLLTILPTGQAYVSRYSNNATTHNQMTSSVWLVHYASWVVD